MSEYSSSWKPSSFHIEGVVANLHNLLELAQVYVCLCPQSHQEPHPTHFTEWHGVSTFPAISRWTASTTDLRAYSVRLNDQDGWMPLTLTSRLSFSSNCTARVSSSCCFSNRKLSVVAGSTTAATRASLDEADSASAPPPKKCRGIVAFEWSSPSPSEDSIASEGPGVLEELLCVSMRQGGWVTRPATNVGVWHSVLVDVLLELF